MSKYDELAAEAEKRADQLQKFAWMAKRDVDQQEMREDAEQLRQLATAIRELSAHVPPEVTRDAVENILRQKWGYAPSDRLLTAILDIISLFNSPKAAPTIEENSIVQVPPLPSGMGWQALARRKNPDEWMYVNHAKEWHLFPGPCPPPAPLPPICGMSVEKIEQEMRRERNKFTAQYCWGHHDSASVAHRLAQPAPVADPDAEAKRLAWLHYTTMNSIPARALYKSPDALWDSETYTRDGWRAVAAAAEKGNG